MKHIVVILGNYYPAPDANGVCTKKIIDELKKENKISVICKNTFNCSEFSSADNVDIYLVNNLRNKLFNNFNNKRKNAYFKIFIFILRIIRLILSVFLWPSSEKWYISKSLSLLERINKSHIVDAILTVSFPYEAHICGQKYKLKNPQVKWVTYSLDHFSNSPTLHKYALFKRRKIERNIRSERSIFHDADMNFITEGLANWCESILKINKSKLKVISFPLISENKSTEKEQIFDTSKLNLIFAGTFYKDIRNPEYLLRLISGINCNNLVLHLFSRGDCAAIIKEYATISGDMIINHGSVPLDTIYNATEQSNILVNVGNNVSEMIPSKILEYISTGKPIINIHKKGISYSNMLSKYPYVLNIEEKESDLEKNREDFLEFCLNNFNKRESFDYIKSLYEESTPKFIANLFLNEM